MEKEKVSIILCFYNEEKYIKYAIDSVLAQTYNNFELIIINDGSSDKSESIIKEYSDDRIIYRAYEDNHGLAFARNRGLEIATGEYVGFFDADDIMVSTKIEKQIRYFHEHNDILLVSGGFCYMDSEGVVDEKKIFPKFHSNKEINARMLFDDCVACAGAALFKREIVVKNHIKLDEESGATEDYRLWIDMLPYGKFANIDEIFFYYRINHGSKTTEIIKRDMKRYDECLIRLFIRAWEDRGFQLSKDDIEFMYFFLYCHKDIKKYRDIRKAVMIYKKIRSQIKRLALSEGKLILKYYRQQWMRSYYYIRVLEDIYTRRILRK